MDCTKWGLPQHKSQAGEKLNVLQEMVKKNIYFFYLKWKSDK